MEETALETLEKIGVSTHREVEKSEEHHTVNALRRMPVSRRWIKLKEQDNAFFLGYDASSNSLSEYALISGVLMPVTLRHHYYTLKLTQKDILDILNPFKRSLKTYDKELDKNFVIETNELKLTTRILNDTVLRKKLISLFRKVPGLMLEINKHELEKIMDLKGKVLLRIIKKEWIFDPEIIDELFSVTRLVYKRMLELQLVAPAE